MRVVKDTALYYYSPELPQNAVYTEEMEGRECKPAGTGALDPAGVPRWPSLPWHSISRVLERGSHYFNTAFQATRVLTEYSLGVSSLLDPSQSHIIQDSFISFQLHGSIVVSSIHDISACCSPQRKTKQFPTLARNSLACQFNHSGASHDGQILASSCRPNQYFTGEIVDSA